MTAVGIDDEVEYFDVSLGLGSVDIKPKMGSTCLIGIIENKDTSCYLLSCDEIEEIDINVEECQFKINDGFLLKKQNETLKQLMGDLIQACRNMVFKTNSGITIELLTDQEFQGLKTRFNNFLK